MTNPDDFPARGTWSVNQRIASGHYFLTESQGDGTSLITAKPNPIWPGVSDSQEYKTLLEQICARHNEGIREEAETYAEIRKAMHKDDEAEERANLKAEEEEG